MATIDFSSTRAYEVLLYSGGPVVGTPQELRETRYRSAGQYPTPAEARAFADAASAADPRVTGYGICGVAKGESVLDDAAASHE